MLFKQVVGDGNRWNDIDKILKISASVLKHVAHLVGARYSLEVVDVRDVVDKAVCDVDVVPSVVIEIGQQDGPAPVRCFGMGDATDFGKGGVAAIEVKGVAGELMPVSPPDFVLEKFEAFEGGDGF